MVRAKVVTVMRWYAQDETNQEESEQNEVDRMKKGVDSTVDSGAVEFHRLTESNFHGVEVIDWPVKLPPIFFRAATVAFNVQFFDAITEFLVFNSFNIKKRSKWPIIVNALA